MSNCTYTFNDPLNGDKQITIEGLPALKAYLFKGGAEALLGKVAGELGIPVFGVIKKGVVKESIEPSPATVISKKPPQKLSSLHTIINNGNTSAVLEHIKANSTTPLHKILVDKLTGILPDGINIVIADDLKNKRGESGIMNYNYASKTVSVNLSAIAKLKENVTEKAFIHELIHAVTGEKINAIMSKDESTLTTDERMARTQLKLIANLIAKHVEKNGITGNLKKMSALTTENLRELITYGLTEPTFQKMLADIKIGKDKTAWTQFVHAVAKLLGIKLNEEQQTALSALLMVGDSLLGDSQSQESVISANNDNYTGINALISYVDDIKSELVKAQDEIEGLKFKPRDKFAKMAKAYAEELKPKITRLNYFIQLDRMGRLTNEQLSEFPMSTISAYLGHEYEVDSVRQKDWQKAFNLEYDKADDKQAKLDYINNYSGMLKSSQHIENGESESTSLNDKNLAIAKKHHALKFKLGKNANAILSNGKSFKMKDRYGDTVRDFTYDNERNLFVPQDGTGYTQSVNDVTKENNVIDAGEYTPIASDFIDLDNIAKEPILDIRDENKKSPALFDLTDRLPSDIDKYNAIKQGNGKYRLESNNIGAGKLFNKEFNSIDEAVEYGQKRLDFARYERLQATLAKIKRENYSYAPSIESTREIKVGDAIQLTNKVSQRSNYGSGFNESWNSSIGNVLKVTDKTVIMENSDGKKSIVKLSNINTGATVIKRGDSLMFSGDKSYFEEIKNKVDRNKKAIEGKITELEKNNPDFNEGNGKLSNTGNDDTANAVDSGKIEKLKSDLASATNDYSKTYAASHIDRIKSISSELYSLTGDEQYNVEQSQPTNTAEPQLNSESGIFLSSTPRKTADREKASKDFKASQEREYKFTGGDRVASRYGNANTNYIITSSYVENGQVFYNVYTVGKKSSDAHKFRIKEDDLTLVKQSKVNTELAKSTNTEESTQPNNGIKFSKSPQSTNTHTKSTLTSALRTVMDREFGQGWFSRLLDTWKFKVVSREEANEVVGNGKLFSVAWHGSPYDHNGFSHSMIGEGEGALGWGYGTYLTKTKADAVEYKRKLQRERGEGKVYKVDIPDVKTMLDLSKYFDEQSKYVQDALKKIPPSAFGIDGDKTYGEEDYEYTETEEEQRDSLLESYNGLTIYQTLMRYSGAWDSVQDEAIASGLLLDAGIKGNTHTEFGNRDFIVFDEDDLQIIAKYSKEKGNIQAFYNPADDTTYFVAENIDKNKDLLGLILHEIAVHALQLGKNDTEFYAIMEQMLKIARISKPAKQALATALESFGITKVPEQDKPELVKDDNGKVIASVTREQVLHELGGYIVEHHPKLGVVQKFLAWFKSKLRAMGKALPKLEQLKWVRWANSLNESDLVSMASGALRNAPNDLMFDSVGRSGEAVKLSEQQARFYSALRKAFLLAPEKVFTTGGAVKDWINGNAGKFEVKKDEIYWSGLNEWLDIQDKVSRDDVIRFLDANGVEVDTIELNGTPVYPKDSYMDDSGDVMQSEEWRITNDGEELSDDELEELLSDMTDVSGDYIEGEGGNAINSDEWLKQRGGDNYRELIITTPQAEAYNESDRMHYGEVSDGKAVVWSRITNRETNSGEKTLFIEEIQSQRADDYRAKYKGNPLIANDYRDEKYLDNNEKIPEAPFISSSSKAPSTAYIKLVLKKIVSSAIDNNQSIVAWATAEQMPSSENVELWSGAMYGNEQGLNQQGKPSLITQFAGEIARKFGGKIGTVNLSIGTQPALIITPEMRQKVLNEGMPLFSKAQSNVGNGEAVKLSEQQLNLSKNAEWTEKRITRLLSEFAYKNNPNKTKAFAVDINPDDFLRATTIDTKRKDVADSFDNINNEATPLDITKLENEIQPITLWGKLDNGNFSIEDHEGRHRMAALRNAGVETVPVVFVMDSAIDIDFMPSINVIGQKIRDSNAKSFTARYAFPISYAYEENIREEFARNESNSVKFSKSSLQSKITDAIDSEWLNIVNEMKRQGAIEIKC